jgi:F0F1-type ATP synthase beta subunit
VDLHDSLGGCELILADEFAEADESDLFMIGAIDEARERMDTRERAS